MSYGQNSKIQEIVTVLEQVNFSHRTSVSWRVQVQLLLFGMYMEEVQDTLQETDVPRLNFTWAFELMIAEIGVKT